MKILISIDTGASAEYILRQSQLFLRNIQEPEVHVMTVVDLALLTSTQVSDQTMMVDTMQRLANDLQPLAASILGEGKFTFSSELGYPVEQILQKAQAVNAELLILGTHGRTGMDHFLIGSVAEKVLRHADCDTLVVPMKKRQQKP